MTQNYSPKLKEAMAEIRAILLKHDIAGHVVLHEPGFSEFLFEVSPSWSVLRIEGNQARIRSKLQEDFAGDRQAKLKADEGTANMIRHMADLLARDAVLFEQLEQIAAKSWALEHTPGILTPHRPT